MNTRFSKLLDVSCFQVSQHSDSTPTGIVREPLPCERSLVQVIVSASEGDRHDECIDRGKPRCSAGSCTL